MMHECHFRARSQNSDKSDRKAQPPVSKTIHDPWLEHSGYLFSLGGDAVIRMVPLSKAVL